jgi:AraC-like DNA-binding protein
MDEIRDSRSAAPPAPASAWTQRVGALAAVPRLLAAHGADPERVLADAGLARDALDDPEHRIPFAAATALLARCAQATGCAHFGVLAGAEWHLADIGLPGQLARHSATLDEGLRTLVVYLRLNNQGAAAYLRTTAATAEIGYAVFHPALTELAVTYDVVVASAINQVRELLADASWRPSEVLLPRSVPADQRPYLERFGAPVRFNADRAALRFRAAELRRRLPDADAVRRAALIRDADARLGERFLLRVYAALRTLMMEGVVRSDLVAANLAMHKRTLARRLTEDGTTFQRVLDEVRFDVARQLLGETERAVADVAAALGYAEPSVFTRSFRRWSGQSPAEWRRNARA